MKNIWIRCSFKQIKVCIVGQILPFPGEKWGLIRYKQKSFNLIEMNKMYLTEASCTVLNQHREGWFLSAHSIIVTKFGGDQPISVVSFLSGAG